MTRQTATRAVAALAALGVIQGIALVGMIAAADAAEPKEGDYSYSVPDPTSTNGAILAGIFFDVFSDHRGTKVTNFRWVSEGCGRIAVTKSLVVNREGKFTFKGTAYKDPGGDKIKVKVKGKFTSRTKAQVTVKDKDPAVDCGALKKVPVKR